MRAFPGILLLLSFGVGSLPAQSSTLNLSTDLVTLGIASANMVPNQPALDSGPLLESGVKYAASHKLASVVASTGAYYFLSGSTSSSGAHVLLSGATTALTIDLQGSDLYFSHPDKIGLFLSNLTNVTLQNFTIDYQQIGFTQALVTGVNAAQRQIQFTVQSGWQNPSALNALIPAGQAIAYVYVFRNGQPWAGYSRMPAVSPFTDSAVTLTSATATTTVATIRPGDVLVIEARAGSNGILASGLTGCTLRNIKIYSGGAGMRFIKSSSSLLEHVEVMPRPGTDRLMSTVADGFQPQQLGANNTIRLCRSIRTGDDGFSPVTWVFGSVQSVSGARSVQVQGDASTALNGNYPLPNGANVAFERASDGVILGSAVLVSQATATAIGGLPQVVLNFDRDLPANLTGTWVYSTDASWRGDNLIMERNAVEQQASFRGISVWGLMNATLRGNYVHRSSATGIHIVHQLRVGDWIVPPVVNLTVTNNVIDGTNTAGGENDNLTLAGIESLATTDTSTVMSLSPDQNLTLTSNFIANPGRSALWIGNVATALVDANYLFNPNDNPYSLVLGHPPTSTAAQAQQPLVVQTSQGITLGNNPIDQASGRAFVTDTSFKELAAYAPGATIRLSALNLGSIANPSVSLTDADGKSWRLTVTASATHTVDVQLPADVGLGGAVVSLKAVNGSYFGTLFVDNQDNIPAINQATFLVSPGATAVPSAGGTLSFLVTTQTGNAFTVTATDSFVTPGAGAIGTGVVTVAVGKNTGAARTAIIEIAGQSITLTQQGANDPAILTQPASQNVASGGTTLLSVAAPGAQSYQWFQNGTAVTGASNGVLAIADTQPANAGIYTAAITTASGNVTTDPAIVGVLTASKVIGAGSAIALDIPHPNGHIFDQVLLTGAAATITADPGKVTRTSFIDLSDDIVQVEFSGAGSLSMVLDGASGPAAPLNYNQPSVAYMKGHVGIVIAGADDTTNVSVFTVGRATANDPTGAFNILLAPGPTNVPANNGSSLFVGHSATVYDGFAGLSFVAISTANGKFGGLRASDGSFFATKGVTGVYAPGVQFQGPVFLGDLSAFSSATPAIIIGSSPDTRITGGSLQQTNGQPVKVAGLTQLKFTIGSDSGGNLLSAKTNQAVLLQDGVDVTSQVVVNPGP